MAFLCENLDVCKNAVNFADTISGLTEDFPKGNYYLVDQINRASLSIAANIAERITETTLIYSFKPLVSSEIQRQ